MSNCISITPLLLSDTFLTWFQRTNQAISTLNTFQIRGLSASSDFEGIKLTDNGSCFYQIELVHGPFVGFVTDGDNGIYGTGDATNPYNLTLKFNGNEPTLGDEDLTGDDYFIVSDTSDSSSVKKVSAGAILNLIPEENRYFYGPTAPSEPDLLLGDKWFNTTVGSEFTYLYTDTDEDTFVWVDIDHLGRGETGFVRLVGDTMTGTLTGTNASFSGITATNGFIGTLTGTNASFSGITAENASFTSFTAANGFIGTLTGTDASFTSFTAANGFIGTLTGTNASFSGITAANGFIGTLTADRGFRQSENSFVNNEFVTKTYVDLLIPAGTILPYGGDTAPEGFLVCDGSVVSSSTYPNLYSVIGTKFGGNSSNFKLPDLQERFPIGKSTSFTIGTTGGSPKITINQMPSHTHPASSNRLGLIAEDPSLGFRFGDGNSYEHVAQTITVGAAGGGQNYYQPYQVVNYIIKY